MALQQMVFEPAAFTSEKPMGQVRWLDRDGNRILQQYWSITSHSAAGNPVGLHGEWRDVPIETDR
jgi:hypothetical protein